jgi:hypothetical protein
VYDLRLTYVPDRQWGLASTQCLAADKTGVNDSGGIILPGQQPVGNSNN